MPNELICPNVYPFRYFGHQGSYFYAKNHKVLFSKEVATSADKVAIDEKVTFSDIVLHFTC